MVLVIQNRWQRQVEHLRNTLQKDVERIAKGGVEKHDPQEFAELSELRNALHVYEVYNQHLNMLIERKGALATKKHLRETTLGELHALAEAGSTTWKVQYHKTLAKVSRDIFSDFFWGEYKVDGE